MKNCFNCGTLLFENARFCHECGSRTLLEEITCVHCATPNLMGAKFCAECGNSLFEKKTAPSESGKQADLFKTRTEEDLPQSENVSENSYKQNTKRKSEPSSYENAAEIWQLKQAFFDSLKKRVEEEHRTAEYASYIERLQTSRFDEVLDINVRNIYRTIEQKKKDGEPAFKLETYRHLSFENILDTFIIRHCQDLNPIPLPEKILKHQDFDGQTGLFELVLDYLDLEKEPEPVFLDFIKMPLKKLQAASRYFVKTEKDEKIFFICDQSIAGSCKEGFAMTDRALYWRAHLLKPQRVGYRHIISVAGEQDWLLVNEQFFNVNPSLNLKMMKLLKKLQRSV